MKSYIWVTFGFLAVAYYQLSDGAEFKPGANGIEVFAEVDPLLVQEIARRHEVTRLALVDSASLAPAPGETIDPAQAQLETAVLTAIRSQEPSVETAPVSEETRVAVTLPATEAEARDLRSVNGTRVNLREGPGTDHGVLGQLTRGTSVEVLEDDGAGWVRLQVLPEGQIGWIADFLLDEV
ncbi:SH3 domain-containing protein [Marinovum sp.]|uniref:SH3 domain-containing protein n=1 Tax=Marinovum sp. TaxID=2024839 RepID=UPI003A911E01